MQWLIVMAVCRQMVMRKAVATQVPHTEFVIYIMFSRALVFLEVETLGGIYEALSVRDYVNIGCIV